MYAHTCIYTFDYPISDRITLYSELKFNHLVSFKHVISNAYTILINTLAMVRNINICIPTGIVNFSCYINTK